MSKVIISSKQITPDWLTQTLRESGHLDCGKVISVEPGTERRRYDGEGPGFRPQCRIKVSYSTDASPSAPKQLYLKTGSGTKHKLSGYQEIKFYTSVSTQIPYPVTPPYYHAAYDRQSGAYHLLLADISNTHRIVHPDEPASEADTILMLDALARLHACWWGHSQSGTKAGSWSTEAAILEDFSELSRAFPGYVDFLGDRLSVERCRIYEMVLTYFPNMLAHRLAVKDSLTIVHNDAHTGNFLIPRTPETKASYIIDWQQWGVQVGVGDVAYMIALFWYPERRTRLEKSLIRTYHNLLVAHGVQNYDWFACWQDYRMQTINNLFVPFWAWIERDWYYHRWRQLEKAMLAFHDLECMEFFLTH